MRSEAEMNDGEARWKTKKEAFDRMKAIVAANPEANLTDLIKREGPSLSPDYIMSTLPEVAKDPVLKAKLMLEYLKLNLEMGDKENVKRFKAGLNKLKALDEETVARITSEVPEFGKYFATLDKEKNK